ncbi:MAG: glycosyltransferase family 2 protein [Jatrophihabitans sp.]|uniref:glycosyltransferase family 2 protein n=1 Tax=Jatrophihabitans sp. TaxID=1932789 RepID=UPI003F7CDA63
MTDATIDVEAPAAPGGVEPLREPPTLSVLIAARNAARTIGEAVESVLTQTPAPAQVIVSDDGSEDDLTAALRPFGDRVELVRGPWGGVSVARNWGARAARSDWIGLLDADDVWLPGRAAALTTAARVRPDLSIITTDAIVVRQGRPEQGSYYATRRFDTTDQLTAMLRESFVFGAAALRADALRAVGGWSPEARAAEDWDLHLRLVLAGARAGLVRAPLYEYRRSGSSITASRVELALEVRAMLSRLRPTVPTDRQHVLDATDREWAYRAAQSARAARDPRAHALAGTALRGTTQPPLRRARLAAWWATTR